jgi:hypothetical protein
MVEDLRRRLCNDRHEDQFLLVRLSARYWLSDETFVGVDNYDARDATAERADLFGSLSYRRGRPLKSYLSSQTSSMRQPLKMLLTITVSPFTRGCQHVAPRP